ncbi:hypothetical protein C8R46DRAFT_1219292 [Mycena filopes]|nr:hypothetical protein C8R46DRAFT_1219292 [Mycena filopes]
MDVENSPPPPAEGPGPQKRQREDADTENPNKVFLRPAFEGEAKSQIDHLAQTNWALDDALRRAKEDLGLQTANVKAAVDAITQWEIRYNATSEQLNSVVESESQTRAEVEEVRAHLDGTAQELCEAQEDCEELSTRCAALLKERAQLSKELWISQSNMTDSQNALVQARHGLSQKASEIGSLQDLLRQNSTEIASLKKDRDAMHQMHVPRTGDPVQTSIGKEHWDALQRAQIELKANSAYISQLSEKVQVGEHFIRCQYTQQNALEDKIASLESELSQSRRDLQALRAWQQQQFAFSHQAFRTESVPGFSPGPSSNSGGSSSSTFGASTFGGERNSAQSSGPNASGNAPSSTSSGSPPLTSGGGPSASGSGSGRGPSSFTPFSGPPLTSGVGPSASGSGSGGGPPSSTSFSGPPLTSGGGPSSFTPFSGPPLTSGVGPSASGSGSGGGPSSSTSFSGPPPTSGGGPSASGSGGDPSSSTPFSGPPLTSGGGPSASGSGLGGPSTSSFKRAHGRSSDALKQPKISKQRQSAPVKAQPVKNLTTSFRNFAQKKLGITNDYDFHNLKLVTSDQVAAQENGSGGPQKDQTPYALFLDGPPINEWNAAVCTLIVNEYIDEHRYDHADLTVEELTKEWARRVATLRKNKAKLSKVDDHVAFFADKQRKDRRLTSRTALFNRRKAASRSNDLPDGLKKLLALLFGILNGECMSSDDEGGSTSRTKITTVVRKDWRHYNLINLMKWLDYYGESRGLNAAGVSTGRGVHPRNRVEGASLGASVKGGLPVNLYSPAYLTTLSDFERQTLDSQLSIELPLYVLEWPTNNRFTPDPNDLDEYWRPPNNGRR